MKKLRWGVLGVAKIAVDRVVPAMQRGEASLVTAIASRDRAKADAAAAKLGIATAYGSYDALLADADVDAVYIPLPNHLHVPWTSRAAEAGKHVLCEKPIAMSAGEARGLIDVRDRTGVQIQEAFMIRAHPQWLKARELARDGPIGQLRSILGYFSYFNDTPTNIRNIAAFGGGGLMDIGCYLINVGRFIFDREPDRLLGLIDRDPVLKVDRMTSMLLDFGTGHLAATCSTQLMPYQRVHILGTRGRIEIEIPVNAPPDRPCRIFVDSSAGVETIELAICDQYTLQADLFSKAILEGRRTRPPLEDSVANMACIDAVFRSAETGRWEIPTADSPRPLPMS
ncbi:MAG: NAD-binding protein [Acidobacteria bacterium]|nr:MAG: NAD-binding protein [Acidobacteriota bacterium]PYR42775.1 MAG: NAD-binding protein [Acidobacteriota bacterium]